MGIILNYTDTGSVNHLMAYARISSVSYTRDAATLVDTVVVGVDIYSSKASRGANGTPVDSLVHTASAGDWARFFGYDCLTAASVGLLNASYSYLSSLPAYKNGVPIP